MKLTSTKHYNYLKNAVNGLFIINIPIKSISATIVGIVIYFTGAEAQILEMILMLLIADLFMGVLTALKYKTFSSNYLVSILYKTSMYLILLMGVNWSVAMCPYLSFLRYIMYLLIVSTELVSILENADLLGFKYSKKVIAIINKNVEDKLKKE